MLFSLVAVCSMLLPSQEIQFSKSTNLLNLTMLVENIEFIHIEIQCK